MFNPHYWRLRFYHLSQKATQILSHFTHGKQHDKINIPHELTEEEKIDETIRESFPASDPPGHISKSSIDKQLHDHI